MRAIKDALFFRASQDIPNEFAIYHLVFPWDKNPQDGVVCACVLVTLARGKRQIQRGLWCMPYSNPFLGEKIEWEDLPDVVQSAARVELAEYTTKGK